MVDMLCINMVHFSSAAIPAKSIPGKYKNMNGSLIVGLKQKPSDAIKKHPYK
jgi:hypothetical protein